MSLSLPFHIYIPIVCNNFIGNQCLLWDFFFCLVVVSLFTWMIHLARILDQCVFLFICICVALIFSLRITECVARLITFTVSFDSNLKKIIVLQSD